MERQGKGYIEIASIGSDLLESDVDGQCVLFLVLADTVDPHMPLRADIHAELPEFHLVCGAAVNACPPIDQ